MWKVTQNGFIHGRILSHEFLPELICSSGKNVKDRNPPSAQISVLPHNHQYYSTFPRPVGKGFWVHLNPRRSYHNPPTFHPNRGSPGSFTNKRGTERNWTEIRKFVSKYLVSTTIPVQAIPGTSAAAGIAQGTVTERQILVEDDTLHRQELRSWALGRDESSVGPLATVPYPPTNPTRTRISEGEITRLAASFLGSDRFSPRDSLSLNFGQFQQIITLFLLKVSEVDHPLLHITRIIENEPSHVDDVNWENPYHLWRAMMVLLTSEMFGFPEDIAQAPTEIHWAIRDKHNLLGKIAEIMWIAHQLHRRILDIESLTTSSLPSHLRTLTPGETRNLVQDLQKANKATTLIGDLLLTQKCAYLAALKSPIVTELICNSLADYCESEFDLGIRGNDPQYLTYESWLRRTELGLGSLLGHCMYSALLFSGFDAPTRIKAFKLGSLLGITYQAYEDVSFFRRKSLTDPSWMDLGILPVIFCSRRNPRILLQPHEQIFQEVKSCPVSLAQATATYEFLKEETIRELTSLDQLENITARDILINFIHSLQPLR